MIKVIGAARTTWHVLRQDALQAGQGGREERKEGREGGVNGEKVKTLGAPL